MSELDGEWSNEKGLKRKRNKEDNGGYQIGYESTVGWSRYGKCSYQQGRG
jgi:hypothetical protein